MQPETNLTNDKNLVIADPGNGQEMAPLNIIRTETAFSKYPIHNLAKKGRIYIEILEKTERGAIKLKWEVSYNDRYGQARQLAYKVDTLLINRKIDEVGRPLPKVIKLGSLRQLCKDLGLNQGQAIKDVKKALLQNAFTAINAKVTYKGNDGSDKWLEFASTRYSLVFTGETLPDGREADAVYLILNDIYREILNSAAVRPLNYDYLKELAPAPQRWYEIISRQMFAAIKHPIPHIKYRYSDYCTYSAQQRYYDYDHFKKQMYKVHLPHIKSGYLAKPIRYEETTDSQGKIDWFMFYIPGPKAKAEYRAIHSKRQSKPQPIDASPTLSAGQRALDKPSPQQPSTIIKLGESTSRPIKTESVLPLELQNNAEELVRYFYQTFHNTDTTQLSPKAVEQAAKLITDYGLEKARYVIEYAKKSLGDRSKDTHSFGGVLTFTDRAIGELERRRIQAEQAAKARAELEAKEQAQAEEEMREEEAKARADAHIASLPPEEYQALYDRSKENLIKRVPNITTYSPQLIESQIKLQMRREVRAQQAQHTTTLEAAERDSNSAATRVSDILPPTTTN